MMKHLRKSIRPIMIFIVIIFAVSCFFMYGSVGRRGVTATASDGGDTSGDFVQDYDVAVVNGERIKLSRMELEVAQFIRAMGLEANASSTDYPAFRNTVIDRMATLQELDKEIASRKIAANKEEVDEAIAEIESQFPTREIYLQQLEMSGITEAELKTSVEENIKRSKVVEEVAGVVSTDETELRNFYDMMKTYAFQKPEGFLMDVAHFSTETAAESARGELSSGKGWDDVITAASADVVDYSTTDNRMFIPSEQLTGEVEFLSEISMDVPSKVISFTSEDHMIVVKRAKEEAGTATFDEVSADIEEMLVSQKRTSLQSQFMQELRARATVEIIDQELFKVQTPEASGDVTPGGETTSVTSPVVSEDTGAAGSADGAPQAPAVTSGD
jgi:hypothetical protein